jgi:hypothetical protein
MAWLKGRPRDPGLAAALSLLLPGAGQIYNGDPRGAMLWLAATPVAWLATGGLLGWVCHVAAAAAAHRQARRQDSGPGPPPLTGA